MQFIKKYANRKLYHTSRKRYITLSEIAALVAAGDDLQVIDNESGADITASVLAQAVLQARESALPLSAQLLSGLLQVGDSAWQSLRRGVTAARSRGDDFGEELAHRLVLLVGAGMLSAEAALEWQRTLLAAAGSGGRAVIEHETRAALDRLRGEVARLSAAVDELSRR